MMFVDTGAWFAISVPSDPDHAAATAVLAANVDRLVTTDYVYDEVLTLFRVRRHFDRAREWVDYIRAGHADLIFVEPRDIEAATAVFLAFRDKNWSFTDCVSRAVMERLEISRAFAFDTHFRQFGTVQVFPQPLA